MIIMQLLRVQMSLLNHNVYKGLKEDLRKHIRSEGRERERKEDYKVGGGGKGSLKDGREGNKIHLFLLAADCM